MFSRMASCLSYEIFYYLWLVSSFVVATSCFSNNDNKLIIILRPVSRSPAEPSCSFISFMRGSVGPLVYTPSLPAPCWALVTSALGFFPSQLLVGDKLKLRHIMCTFSQAWRCPQRARRRRGQSAPFPAQLQIQRMVVQFSAPFLSPLFLHDCLTRGVRFSSSRVKWSISASSSSRHYSVCHTPQGTASPPPRQPGAPLSV